jgi:hypothetical protein
MFKFVSDVCLLKRGVCGSASVATLVNEKNEENEGVLDSLSY